MSKKYEQKFKEAVSKGMGTEAAHKYAIKDLDIPAITLQDIKDHKKKLQLIRQLGQIRVNTEALPEMPAQTGFTDENRPRYRQPNINWEEYLDDTDIEAIMDSSKWWR